MSIIQRKPFITGLNIKKLILNTSALKSNRMPIKFFKNKRIKSSTDYIFPRLLAIFLQLYASAQ